MPLVGLTGGIGAGKTTVLEQFADAGCATSSADKIVHDLLDDVEVRDLLVDRWGETVIEGGEVKRDRVAEIVFSEPEKLDWLESVLFPRVGVRLAEWQKKLLLSKKPPQLAVVEVPLLFEAGIEGTFDVTVCVVADDSIREQRLGDRTQVGLAGRADRQLDQGEKAARSDYVIENNGKVSDLRVKVDELIEKLKNC